MCLFGLFGGDCFLCYLVVLLFSFFCRCCYCLGFSLVSSGLVSGVVCCKVCFMLVCVLCFSVSSFLVVVMLLFSVDCVWCSSVSYCGSFLWWC